MCGQLRACPHAVSNVISSAAAVSGHALPDLEAKTAAKTGQVIEHDLLWATLARECTQRGGPRIRSKKDAAWRLVGTPLAPLFSLMHAIGPNENQPARRAAVHVEQPVGQPRAGGRTATRHGPVRGVVAFAERVIREFMADDCPRMAAALSFYTIFSLPPLLALLMLLVGSFVDPMRLQTRLSQQVGLLVGPRGAAQIIALIRSAAQPALSGPTAILGIVALLFGATGAFVQLQGALNYAWQVAPDPRRGNVKVFLVKRLVSVAMIVVVSFLLLVSLVISALLAGFGGRLTRYLPVSLSAASLPILDAVVSLVVIALLFALIFHLVPDAVVKWRHALAGGIFTGLLFTAGKLLIGYYLGRSDPGNAYGAAGSLAVSLLWIYYSAMILLLGAEFTEVWARVRGQPVIPERGAVFVSRKVVPQEHVTSPAAGR